MVSKYGLLCSRLFLIAIAIRLINEVWSNTKVFSLYFGAEGSFGYWFAAAIVTVFTVFYSLLGGLRSSLLTDGAQMLLAAVLLVVILVGLGPGLVSQGLPAVDTETRMAGLTFCGLAFVQIFSYPFHDPVMTDRAFITGPRTMVKAFIWAGVISGGFIFLFSSVGLYARAFGVEGAPSYTVPALFGLPMLLVFNAIMLTSAGSTLDSTFSSTAKLGARDWDNRKGRPTETQAFLGRWWIVAIALLGNLPLLSIYLGDRLGPAIIMATTISGTMVMGLAPIFLLAFLPGARALSFHLAFWPGLLFGVLRVVESAFSTAIFPAWMSLGGGKYAIDLGVNVYGLLLCTAGYLVGAWWGSRTRTSAEAAPPFLSILKPGGFAWHKCDSRHDPATQPPNYPATPLPSPSHARPIRPIPHPRRIRRCRQGVTDFARKVSHPLDHLDQQVVEGDRQGLGHRDR